VTISTRRKRHNILMERVKGFWDSYKKNKKGILGIGIIAFFFFFAIFGPSLSVYDPVNDWDVGGRRVPPAWFKLLPGNQDLVPNLKPVESTGFTDESEISLWEIEFQPDESPGISYSKEGSPFGSGPGSLLISLGGASTNQLISSLNVSKKFEWKYIDPPKRFRSDIAIKVEGVEGVEVILRICLSTPRGESYILWERTTTSDIDWFQPEYKVDSYSLRVKMIFPEGVFADPARSIFNGTGEYKFYLGTSLEYVDEDSPSTPSLYIDDLNFELMGTCFGLLGTDQWGRDVFSQLAHGAKISLMVGLLSAFISVSIGLVVGLFAGFIGGMVDELSMRFADMLLVIPYLPLLLILIAILGQSIWNIIIIISVLGWMSFSRIVRSQVLSLKERAFIEAARAAGGSTTHIAIRHVLPNVMGLVFVSIATNVPAAITAEAALSFLGLGDPRIMSWGQMLHDVVYHAAIKELYWVVPPGLCIALLALSFVMMGFSLDEILNPRLRRR
jgi:peptide/nickel transport system permease protein